MKIPVSVRAKTAPWKSRNAVADFYQVKKKIILIQFSRIFESH